MSGSSSDPSLTLPLVAVLVALTAAQRPKTMFGVYADRSRTGW